MTLSEAQELLGDWDELPPPALSLARIAAMLESFLGIKRRPEGRRPGEGREPVDPAHIPGLARGDVHAGLGGAAILDFAALKARAAHG